MLTPPAAKTRPLDCAHPQDYPYWTFGHGDLINIYPYFTSEGYVAETDCNSIAILDNNYAIVVYNEYGDYDDDDPDISYSYERLQARVIGRDGTVYDSNLIAQVEDPDGSYYGYDAYDSAFNVVRVNDDHALVSIVWTMDEPSWPLRQHILLLKVTDVNVIEVVDTYESTFELEETGNMLAMVPGTSRFINIMDGPNMIVGNVSGDTIVAEEYQYPKALTSDTFSYYWEYPVVACDETGKFLVFHVGSTIESYHYITPGRLNADLIVEWGDPAPFPDEYAETFGGRFSPPVTMMTDDGDFLIPYMALRYSGGLHHLQAFGCPISSTPLPDCYMYPYQTNQNGYHQMRLMRVKVNEDLSLTTWPPHLLDGNTAYAETKMAAVYIDEGEVAFTYGTGMLFSPSGGQVLTRVTADDASPSGLTAPEPGILNLMSWSYTYQNYQGGLAMWPDHADLIWIQTQAFEIISTDWPNECDWDYVWNWNYDWAYDGVETSEPDDYHYGSMIWNIHLDDTGPSANVSYLKKFNPYSKVLSSPSVSATFRDIQEVAAMNDGTQRRSTYNRIYMLDNGKFRVLHNTNDPITRN